MEVLVVDDHELMRQLVGMTLEPLGYSIRFASTAEEAIDELHRCAPDVAVVDVMMPGEMNGLDLCKHIKSTPCCSRTKVIMLTARSQVFDIQAGNEAGADHYITKPFSPLELVTVLESMSRKAGAAES